eukprot:4052080-Ditylum_brightwellii.AAC.1
MFEKDNKIKLKRQLFNIKYIMLKAHHSNSIGGLYFWNIDVIQQQEQNYNCGNDEIIEWKPSSLLHICPLPEEENNNNTVTTATCVFSVECMETILKFTLAVSIKQQQKQCCHFDDHAKIQQGKLKRK